jgi:hypothetical protein
MATLTEEDIAGALAWAKSATMPHSGYYQFERSQIAKLLAHITEQSAQIARMDEALEPFMDFYGPQLETGDAFSDESIVSRERFEGGVRVCITLGDLRRAALTKAGTP